MAWLSENWYVILGLLWLAIIGIAAFYFRRHPNASGARFVFYLVPFANPNPPLSTGPTPLALVVLGLLIVLLAMLFVSGFV